VRLLRRYVEAVRGNALWDATKLILRAALSFGGVLTVAQLLIAWFLSIPFQLRWALYFFAVTVVGCVALSFSLRKGHARPELPPAPEPPPPYRLRTIEQRFASVALNDECFRADEDPRAARRAAVAVFSNTPVGVRARDLGPVIAEIRYSVGNEARGVATHGCWLGCEFRHKEFARGDAGALILAFIGGEEGALLGAEDQRYSPETACLVPRLFALRSTAARISVSLMDTNDGEALGEFTFEIDGAAGLIRLA